MSALPPECPRCRVRMIQGFVADVTHGGVQVAHWVEGPPEKSFWTGTKVPKDKQVPIGTFRCPTCGLLESYARPEFERS